MAETDESYLRRCFEKGTCPACGKNVDAGTPVGSGKIGEGRFCSLNCHARYNERQLLERHKQRLAAAKTEKPVDYESDC